MRAYSTSALLLTLRGTEGGLRTYLGSYGHAERGQQRRSNGGGEGVQQQMGLLQLVELNRERH